MKKVLIFSTAYLPYVGGAELAVKEITDRIGDVEFDMITLSFGGPSFERIGNINVYRINCPKLFFSIFAFLKARKMRPDLIWSIMANRAGFAALFFKIFNPKIPFLLTLQEGDPFDYPKKQVGIFWIVLKPLFIAIFRRADHVQAISNYLAQWAKNMGAKNVEVIPNGVDTRKFEIRSTKSETNDKILITVSRLVKKNAVGDIIEALKFLPENIKLWIIGDGPEKENYKINERVKFLGEIKNNDLPKYLAEADIFVRPSLSEGLGTAFLEAMAAGVPVIGTRVGGIPDFLKHGETGLFCEVNNPKSIAEKVMEYINNPGQTDKIVENAQKLVRENYDWSLISAKIRGIINRLCVS
jgi:glycosyltransferase involved in cell wall biosynthesis